MSMTTAVLLLSCPDRPGIVAAVADFVFRHGGNIVDAQQHTDRTEGVFFQRIEFELEGADLDRDRIQPAMHELVDRFDMQCAVRFSDEVPRVGVLVSREGHCLVDLLARSRSGELAVEIPVVISNHEHEAEVASWFGVDYRYLPVTADTKPEQEAAMQRALDEHGVTLVVLARYMQILSPEFCDRWRERIINIHHSFLPAFSGGRPYHQAHERGVKLVGVTAHYATAALDDGPIIDQDVVRVSHRDSIEDLRRRGRDLEVVVLARAVRAHVEHRVLVHGRRTVVFD
ncbi:MAG TPA: formyltetrahydrofolate deformylase [Acidimicrobiia bacterium]|nr:formyltetrahydrofolate deformylase [Acidimicrobiia bacterium]